MVDDLPVPMPDHQMLSRSFQPRPIIDPVATRPYGMRDFTVEDPDGHRFTLGQADDSLPDVARCYGLNSDEIVAKPELAQGSTIGSHLAVADQ